VVGQKELFDRVYNVNITVAGAKQAGVGAAVQSDKDLTIPSSLSNLVEKVLFTPPYELLP
jgi:hypothetical protein